MAARSPQNRDDHDDPWSSVSIVVSIAALQDDARRLVAQRTGLPDLGTRLGGMTRVIGWMNDGEDIWLLGARDASAAQIELDDLALALRSAYRVSETYNDAPGVSIDPRRGESEPWSVQDVRVFGLPDDCAMAARFVALDYELKKAAAGLAAIDQSIPSVCDLARRDVQFCSNDNGGQTRDASHRLWFCAKYSERPRFLWEEASAFIRMAVGVQVLTEQEFFDGDARRIGAGPADRAVGQFTSAVSEFLASGRRPSYERLRSDFRLVEAAKLLRIVGGPVEPLAYLLDEHVLATESVPRFVTGIRREEHVEVTCDGEIAQKQVGGRRIVESRMSTVSHRYRFEGGVTCDVAIAPDTRVTPTSAQSAALRRRITAARPSEHSVAWEVAVWLQHR
jgi:hypothetical protein